MNTTTIAVSASGLGKRYRLGTLIDRDASLAATIARSVVAPARNFRNLRSLRRFDDDAVEENVLWALRDVSFDLHRGEVLGVIGRNGAGKSTLLKILSRITEPTEGRVELHGRISSLIEVGTGFHPDLTGRDNVFLKGTMLGMTRREVALRFDDIIAFAELEQFVETPVKRYSSGMYVRLAFAVAAHLDPDVLIADEVLAVGDAEFQRRSVGKMRAAAEENGRSVIFVSHDMSVVSSLCTRALWLDRGGLKMTGGVDEVLEAYVGSLETEPVEDVAYRNDRLGSGAVRVTGVGVVAEGAPGSAIAAGAPVEVQIRYAAEGGARLTGPLDVSVTIETLLREKLVTASTRFMEETFADPPADGLLVCSFPGLPLNEGDYMCTVRLEVGGQLADWIADTTRFRIDPTRFFAAGIHPSAHDARMLLPHSWRLDAG